MAHVDRLRVAQQISDGGGKRGRVVDLVGILERGTAQELGQRRRARAMSGFGRQPLVEMSGRGAVAVGVEQAGEQLLGGLAGLELERFLLGAGEHQPRLQLEEGRDQHQELGRRLEVELPATLQVVDVRDHDLREVHLEHVDLLPQDQRQQEVERPGEDV